MNTTDRLVDRFAAERDRLTALAYRILGSHPDAEDVVQDCWIRLAQDDHTAVENLGGWLTTVVSRACLDRLRYRQIRRHEPLNAVDEATPEPGPEHETMLAESVGLAMLVVLDAMEPAERVAFVLHDVFAIPFNDVASILERSPAAARKLASRGRRRVQHAGVPSVQDERHAGLVTAFLAASRRGDFQALLSLLADNATLHADPVAVHRAAVRRGRGAPELAAEVRGAHAVADTFSGRAADAQLVLIDGVLGAAWAPNDRPVILFQFLSQHGKITAVSLVADPETISQLEIVLL
jgi:RNA polymerase sigma factor (sigma-70 family)